MLNRFKTAFYSVVNNIDTISPDKSADVGPNGEHKIPLKYPYSRPQFLQLNGEDEIQVAGDHLIRPIIVPRDITRLPWNAGYAEAVNAGKSLRNEDQGRLHVGYLERESLIENGGEEETFNFDIHSLRVSDVTANARHRLPYVYFALFDGHAGTGAALSASHELHRILHGKLMEVIDHLLPPSETATPPPQNRNQMLYFPEKEISVENFVVGALESAFHTMDNLIAADRLKYRVTGGCTVVVSLFICGKLFVANAGDSRAVLCRGKKSFPLSNDFTPETERQRIRKLAALQPELLGNEYTALDYSRRPNRRDVGQRLLYREPHMTGWAYKTITADDLKFPVVYGEGKRSRVLATIGVTRGFGDHDLRAPNSNIFIKPFLSSQPEVRIVDLEKETIYDTDVLVMGTDGLWDVSNNERVADVANNSLEHFPPDDEGRYRYRFTSAAQDLVMSSRGKLNDRSWRTSENKSATIDDISVFVIPLAPYKEEWKQWKQIQSSATESTLNNSVEPSGYVSFGNHIATCNINASTEEEPVPIDEFKAPAAVQEIVLPTSPPPLEIHHEEQQVVESIPEALNPLPLEIQQQDEQLPNEKDEEEQKKEEEEEEEEEEEDEEIIPEMSKPTEVNEVKSEETDQLVQF